MARIIYMENGKQYAPEDHFSLEKSTELYAMIDHVLKKDKYAEEDDFKYVEYSKPTFRTVEPYFGTEFFEESDRYFVETEDGLEKLFLWKTEDEKRYIFAVTDKIDDECNRLDYCRWKKDYDAKQRRREEDKNFLDQY